METQSKTNKTPKVWNEDDIKALLERSPAAVDRAMLSLDANPLAVDPLDRMMIRQFSRYVQGLDNKGKPKWKPKSLACGHAKIFIAQGLVPKGTRTLDFARELAIKSASVLTRIANGKDPIPAMVCVRLIQRGRYKDTEELYAYRNDSLPNENKTWPLIVEHRGAPTPDDYVCVVTRYETKGDPKPMTENEFLTGYTLVFRRECYLD